MATSILQASNPKALNPKVLKPSSPQTIKPSSPKAQKALKLQSPKTQNLKNPTFTTQVPKKGLRNILILFFSNQNLCARGNNIRAIKVAPTDSLTKLTQGQGQPGLELFDLQCQK